MTQQQPQTHRTQEATSGIKTSRGARKPPPHFLCALTNQVMVEPMLSKYGNRFERAAILGWLQDQGNDHCPVTKKPLRQSNLISDTSMRFKIQMWLKNVGSCNAPLGNEEFNHSGANESNSNDQQTTCDVNRACTALPLPQRFVCPITKKLMVDPVMTKTGINYERSAIIQVLQTVGCICPVTGKRLAPSGVIANCKLAREISAWQHQQQCCSARKATTVSGGGADHGDRTTIPSIPKYSFAGSNARKPKRANADDTPAAPPVSFFLDTTAFSEISCVRQQKQQQQQLQRQHQQCGGDQERQDEEIVELGQVLEDVLKTLAIE
eukprot:CAMPEP_0119557444 /NCGR_PEP_ID=MMETSP1352-20130426/9110_1 /TAXON_ID=265584 /ORGANISM="Stauroneis constricta, Strain CCMP1120" /LENGTH=322 /DNA_ID=CAMNT_0007604551 /DNA_START=68 /DNA_END=1036 /DNA_ORIENTATION=-